MDLLKSIDWGMFWRVWTFLNSELIVACVIGYTAFLFNKYERSATGAANKTEDLEQLIAYIEQARSNEEDVVAELPAESQPPLNEPDFRDEADAVVRDAKNYLEGKVKNADGRYQRALKRIPRHDYTVLAVALHERKLVTSSQLAAASTLFTEWKRYSKGRAAYKLVPKAVLEHFQHNFEQLVSP